jgi:hypothetical protein
VTLLYRRTLFWMPRIVSLGYIAFFCLFALVVSGDSYSYWRTIIDFIHHLVPALVLSVGLILAWRWEWIGTVLYSATGIIFIVAVFPLPISVNLKLNWILTVAGPAFLVSGLFLANWLKRGDLHSHSLPSEARSARIKQRSV